MRYRFIDEERSHHAVSRICRALGVTRAGYYAWKKRGASPRRIADEAIGDWLEYLHEHFRSIYGAPRLTYEFTIATGVGIGCKRVARIMRDRGMRGTAGGPRRRHIVLPPECVAAPDLVNRSFRAEAPDQLWLADITYIPTWEGWVFLAAVMDMCSRKVVGWSMADSLHADVVVDALRMAVARRRPEPGTIHHSDRGSQYRSVAFGRTLRDFGLVASMGSRGDAYDNAATESFMATFKKELVHVMTFPTKDKARLETFDYIECFYNTQRRHSQLGRLSPVEYEARMREGATAAPAA